MNERPSLRSHALNASIESFRSGELGLRAAAKRANMPLSEFISFVSEAGIPVLDQTAEEYEADVRMLDAWLKV
jgi:predicted HTH domain antitoxin